MNTRTQRPKTVLFFSFSNTPQPQVNNIVTYGTVQSRPDIVSATRYCDVVVGDVILEPAADDAVVSNIHSILVSTTGGAADTVGDVGESAADRRIFVEGLVGLPSRDRSGPVTSEVKENVNTFFVSTWS